MIRKWHKLNLQKISRLRNYCMHLILCVRFPGTIFDWQKGPIAEEFQNFLQGSKLYEGRTMSAFSHDGIPNSWPFTGYMVAFQ